MSPKSTVPGIRAAYPISDTQLVVLLEKSLRDKAPAARSVSSINGLRIRSVTVDPERPERLVLTTSSMRSNAMVVDRLTIRGLAFTGAARPVNVTSPAFVHGTVNPTQLKVPNLDSAFPYASKLIGVHVSVACCTGCNGGVHDRDLVVLNHHVGGPWTGIWVQTGKTIEAPYPRWQKVLCAGGVIAERSGSTTVVDHGWMEIHKQFEVPHHAPPALPIQSADLPNSRSDALLLKGLDASWVQFDDISIESARYVAPSPGRSKAVSLARNEITFSDRSGAQTTAFLYQPSGLKIQAGQRLSRLRGFVHAEKPGRYVLLSDKEEDLFS